MKHKPEKHKGPGRSYTPALLLTQADKGLSVTAAFTIFAKTVARERRIPFDVTADPWSETVKAMEDVEHGRGLSGPYRSRQALQEALDA